MNEEFITGKIELAIDGEPIKLEMTVPKNKVKLRKMLPVFQRMALSVVDIGVEKIKFEGKEVSCKKGCGACCKQLVPVSEAEAFQIAELVEKMPEPRRSQIKEKFQKACEHFASINWFSRLDKISTFTKTEAESLGIEYFEQNIDCPFLEDASCSIHQDRPLICREYLVTTPAENCENPTSDTIERVKMLFSTSDIVRQMEDNPKPINFVPLVMALAWSKQSPFEQTEKTGQDWMADFFTRLTKKEIPQ